MQSQVWRGGANLYALQTCLQPETLAAVSEIRMMHQNTLQRDTWCVVTSECRQWGQVKLRGTKRVRGGEVY